MGLGKVAKITDSKLSRDTYHVTHVGSSSWSSLLKIQFFLPVTQPEIKGVRALN